MAKTLVAMFTSPYRRVAVSPSSGILILDHDRITQHPDFFDFDFNHIAGLQILWRLQIGADPTRRAGQNNRPG